MADNLNPELKWIEGRCYRVTDVATERIGMQDHDLYENEVIYDDLDDATEDEDYEIMHISDNRYMTSFHISKNYYGSIIGKKGGIKNKIEHETNTEIRIPKHGQPGDVIIFGPSEANVKAARRRINIIVISSRLKQKSTHFISIPMINQDIVKNFENFKDSVLKEYSDRGLDESLFIKSTKLHITTGVMCLMDNEERLQASKLLTDAKNKIMTLLQPHIPLKLRLKGLSYMNDDPSQIDILYGCVTEVDAPSGLLQNLANTLVKHYYEAGFMKEKEHGRENVKIHVTFMNTKYRSCTSSETNMEQGSHHRRRRETFDGTRILDKFRDYDFGVVEPCLYHSRLSHSVVWLETGIRNILPREDFLFPWENIPNKRNAKLRDNLLGNGSGKYSGRAGRCNSKNT